MTQMMTERLTHEEYCHLLAYGEPERTEHIAYDQAHDYGDNASHLEWISTLASTTYPDMTFGYHELPCMYTVV